MGDDEDAVFTSTNSDLINIAPQLAYLANYGGPTLTHRLLNGSPAIDAGSNDLTFDIDQRGEARIFNNTADIGAYEYDPTTTIQEYFSEVKTRLYPNPNNGSFTLNFTQVIAPVSYQIVNITGQTIFQKNVSNNLTKKLKKRSYF